MSFPKLNSEIRRGWGEEAFGGIAGGWWGSWWWRGWCEEVHLYVATNNARSITWKMMLLKAMEEARQDWDENMRASIWRVLQPVLCCDGGGTGAGRGGRGTTCYQGRIMTSLASRGTQEGHAAIQYLNSSPSILSSAINCCGDAELESSFLGLRGFSFDVCEARVSIRGSVERIAARPREYDPRNLIQSKVYLASFSVLKSSAPLPLSPLRFLLPSHVRYAENTRQEHKSHVSYDLL